MKSIITFFLIALSTFSLAQDNNEYIKRLKGSLNKCDFKYVKDNFRRMKGDRFNKEKISYNVKNKLGKSKEVNGIPKVVLGWYLDELEQIIKDCQKKKSFDQKYLCVKNLHKTYKEKAKFRKKGSTKDTDLPLAEGSISLLSLCIEKLEKKYKKSASLKKKRDAAKKAQDLANAKRKAEHERKMKNGEFEFERACELTRAANVIKKAISDERRAGAISGVVNKSALHDFGVKLVSINDAIAILKKDYKSKTSKKLLLKKCP